MPEKQKTIAEAVCTINKVVIRALMFLKLYLIHNIDNPPAVNADRVDTIFKTVCLQKAIGRPHSQKMKVLRDTLTDFYKLHFAPLLPAEDISLSYTYLSIVLAYAAVQMVTLFETNIKQHYVEYVELYVKVVWQKQDLIARIRRTRKTKKDREAAVRKLVATLRNLKIDLLNVVDEPFK